VPKAANKQKYLIHQVSLQLIAFIIRFNSNDGTNERTNNAPNATAYLRHGIAHAASFLPLDLGQIFPLKIEKGRLGLLDSWRHDV
jgi:hypothetical protein